MGLSPGSPKSAPLIPRRYMVRCELGSGSLGTVYLAFDGVRKRLVALKLLRIERLTHAAVASLQLEFQAIAPLRHPRIAAAYDFGYTDGSRLPFYTREYISGVPLPAGPPVAEPPGPFLEPILDLLDALSYLHANGVLHLDIHAGNLILAEERKRGSVLIDFSLAPSPSNRARAVTGKGVAWAPPELARGASPTPRTDLYLAGRLLQLRLTGRVDGAIRVAVEGSGWPQRQALELERIATKALQPDPERRFASAEEFREALEEAIGGERRLLSAVPPRETIAGRDREIDAVESRLRDLAAGESSALCLIGKVGLGKSRLLNEARLRAQIRGFDVIEVSGLRHSRGGSPLVDALRRACSGPRGGGSWLKPLDSRHGGTPAERARRAAEMYFHVEGKPLVLIVDDVECADGETRALVTELAVLCGGAMRGDKACRAMAVFTAGASESVVGIPKHGHWRLAPLSRNAARSVFRGILAPFKAESLLEDEALGLARGVPLALRRLALAVREARQRSGAFPRREALPAMAAVTLSVGGRPPPAPHRKILEALSLLSRPVQAPELAAGLRERISDVRGILRSLAKSEAVVSRRAGRDVAYRLHPSFESKRLARGWTPAAVRKLHERLAARLRSVAKRSPWEEEWFARHLLAAGKRREGAQAALQAARALRKRGLFERALGLLRLALSKTHPISRRFGRHNHLPGALLLDLAEELSRTATDLGDHTAAIRTLGPIARVSGSALSRMELTRVRRWLGIHHHRAGQVADALRVFKTAEREADPHANLEDLVSIDAELGELFTLHGRSVEAEEALRRGLERLGSAPREASFRLPMAVSLHASLGHLELRRMNLSGSRDELETALKLSRRTPDAAFRVSILNNLGIAANQMNDFARARECFAEAERLLLGAGERRGTIEIACNLAVIAAKLGEREKASLHLEEAILLDREYPGARLDFFVAYTRGLVAHLLGDAKAAIAGFEEAIPAGRAIGDEHLVQYGEAYLAEDYLLAGDYRRSANLLRKVDRQSAGEAPALLRRMILSRRSLLEALIGRRSAARRSLTAAESVPRTQVELLEAWNGLFLGATCALLARKEAGDAFRPDLEGSLEVFSRLGIGPGAQLARLALLAAELSSASASGVDRSRVEEGLKRLDATGGGGHKLLSVAEPLVRAEAAFILGDVERAESFLETASGAIAGAPFLELDWRIELLWARISNHRRDVRGARFYLQRSLHARDLLAERLPASARRNFLSQPRFHGLAEAEIRWRNTPGTVHSTEALRRSAAFEGMVGVSSPMIRIFQTIQRAADVEVPVLIVGETGTGKELAARAIHRLGARSKSPFLVLDCASLPAQLFEAELFGATAGAYTGAERDRPGLLESVAGGTLLLDEVAHLPVDAQAKLLHVLDTGSFRRLGGVEARQADVRFLATTSLSLEEALRDGRIRADVYYRLRALEVRMPPLRDRREDIVSLARHLLEKHARRLGLPVPEVSPDAIETLEGYPWPGNVRELENALLRAVVGRPSGHRIRRADLEPSLTAAGVPLFNERLIERHDLGELRTVLERQYLTRLFLSTGGDLGRMLEKLKVKRTWLYVWLRRLGIDIKALRERLKKDREV